MLTVSRILPLPPFPPPSPSGTHHGCATTRRPLRPFALLPRPLPLPLPSRPLCPLLRLPCPESDFGAALDMLTDRLCTGALLTLLSHLYQPFAPVFLGLIVLDGYSHWLQMAACVCGRGAWGRGREREGTSGLRGRQRRAAGGWRAAAVVERGGGGVGGNGGRPGRVCYMRIAPRPTQLRWV